MTVHQPCMDDLVIPGSIPKDRSPTIKPKDSSKRHLVLSVPVCAFIISSFLSLEDIMSEKVNAVSEELGTAIRRTALQREIRQVDCDKHKEMQNKKDELMAYKKELLGKVEEHLASLERMNSKKADLAVFKQELYFDTIRQADILFIFASFHVCLYA